MIEKMLLTSKEYGVIACSPLTANVADVGVLSLQASGEFGSLLFYEAEENGFDIVHSQMSLVNDMSMRVSVSPNDFVVMHFMAENDLPYRMEGVMEGIMLKNQHNFFHVPLGQLECDLKKDHVYTSLSIIFKKEYLREICGPYVLMMKFLDEHHGENLRQMLENHTHTTPRMMVIIEHLISSIDN
jgi:hypothetical protein